MATLAVGAMLCVAAQAKMPPNSYLVETQDTVQGLIAQVNKYPVVRDRYERHFGMSKSEIELYFSTLRLVKLDKSGSYLVYNVPEQTGELRSRVLNLKKGTKVWIDNQGGPTLQWICGNPMTRGPRVVASLNDFQTPESIEHTDPSAERRDVADPAEVARTDETVPVAKDIEPTTPAVATMAPSLTTPEVANIPIEAVNGPAAMLPGTGGPGGFDFGKLFGLPFLGGIVYGAGQSARGSGGSTVSPVPEPTTILVLGLGASVLLRKRNKKS